MSVEGKRFIVVVEDETGDLVLNPMMILNAVSEYYRADDKRGKVYILVSELDDEDEIVDQAANIVSIDGQAILKSVAKVKAEGSIKQN